MKTARKTLFTSALLLLMTLVCLTAVSCGKDDADDKPIVVGAPVSLTDTAVSSAPPPEPVNVSLSDTAFTLGVGITRRPEAVGGEQIVWRSSDEGVATVDPDGTVKGAAPGECEITAENEFGRTATCQVTVKKTCYLTIDDGPLKYAGDIIKALDSLDVKATFFVVSTYNLPIVEKMHAGGHLVGMHTYNHRFRICYRSSAGYFADLEKLADKVEGYTGERPTVIRFPGGTGNTVCQALEMRRLVNGADDLGYRVFDWTALTGDAEVADLTPSAAARRALGGCTEDQEIVLMHDKAITPDALKILVPKLRAKGYVFETLDHYPDRSFETPCQYSRKNKDVPAESVAVSETEKSLAKGKTFTLTASMTPAKSTDYVRWESSDPSVASVTLEGKVKGKSAGEADVTAITSSGCRAVCHVTVSE